VFPFVVLGLVAQRPRHGYEIKAAFEDLLGGTWPLNIGQVYTTLARLERDGLVKVEVVRQQLLPDRKVYTITEKGWDHLHRWLAEPVADPIRLKDEFFLKVLVHTQIDGGDPVALIWSQRQRYFQTLSDLNALRHDAALEPATALLLEGAALHVEADLKWLDVCEERVTELKPQR